MQETKLFKNDYKNEEIFNVIKDEFIFSNNLYNYNIIRDISKLETNKYREIINYLEINNLDLVNKIEIERKKYIENQLSLIDKKGIFKYLYRMKEEELIKTLPKESFELIQINKKYDDYISIYRIFKFYTEKCLFEYIIDLYFKDITFNFIADLKMMISYLNNIDDNIVSKERLILYKKILNFYNLNVDEQKQLFYDYNSNINYSSDFYDDYSAIKNHSYNKINESIIKEEQLNKLKNNQLSNKYNVNIYKLNGEEFYMYAHSSKIKDDEDKFPFKNINEDKSLSISLIGHKNISIYKPLTNFIIFGFKKLNIKNIVHICNTDSYSTTSLNTKKFQRIYTPLDLLEKSIGYNEILYKEKVNENLKPDFIICFDEIRDIDLYFAKNENLPIIKINSLKYRKSTIIEDINENIYLTSNEAREITHYK